MERSDRDYYENYFAMFSTFGWKQFIEDTQKALADAKTKAFTGDEDSFLLVKGAVIANERILTLETLMRQTYDLANEGEEE